MQAGGRPRSCAGARARRQPARCGRGHLLRRHGRPRGGGAFVLAGPRVPRARPLHGRAAAPRLLLQRPLRRLPRLPRHRQPRRGGPLARGTGSVPHAERGRHRAVQERQLLPPGAARRGPACGHRRRHPVGGHAEEGPEGALARPRQREGARGLPHRGRPRHLLVHRVGGRARRGEAPLYRGPVRRPAREAVGLFRHGALRDLRRQAPEAGGPRGHGERQVHPRRHGDVGGRVAGVLRGAALHGPGGGHRPAHREGDPRAAALPRGRGPGLPHAGAGHGHALRRRGPAHPARHPDRRRAHGRALHSGRALHRASPARQRAAHRHAGAPARPGQHRGGRGARRGHHPGGRLRGGHGPGRRRARRPRHRGGDAGRGHGHRGLRHGRLPVGAPPHRGAGDASQARARHVEDDRRQGEQPEQRHTGGAHRHAHRGHGRLRLRQELSYHRHAGAGARQPVEPRPSPHRTLPQDHGPGEARQGHQHRPEPHRAHPALEPGHLHRAVGRYPRAVRQHGRGQGPRLRAGALLLQRERRPLRGLQGRRPDQDRDALSARRVRALRGLQRRALQPRDAAGDLPRQEHLRGARHDRGGRPALLREHPGHPPQAADALRRGPRLHPPGPAGDHALRRRGPAREARQRAAEAPVRQDLLHSGRAHHGPALRGRAPAARGAAAPRGRRQHGARHRAQPGCHQMRRPHRGLGPRGRRPRRHHRRPGHA